MTFWGGVQGSAISANPPSACAYCGAYHAGKCPLVKAITYHPDGTVAHVEFFPPPAAQPRCAKCGGSGRYEFTRGSWGDCPACDGKGF